MNAITVRAPRLVIERFKRQAKVAFPRETYAVLIGHEEGGFVEVTEIWIPEDVDRFCSPGEVRVQPLWLVEAEEFAREAGASVVGDIHSHSYQFDPKDNFLSGRHMSESDIDHAIAWRKIAAICRVSQSRSGRLSASVRFWGPVIPVKTEII